MPVPPIPPGYRSVTPYLILEDAARALAWYAEAFGARERMRLPMPNGRIGHAEIEIGDSVVMLADAVPEHGIRDPRALGGSPVTLHLYVAEVDATVARAVAAGAALQRPVENQFYGDRSGTVQDPFGHIWHVASHVEEVPPEEMARRMRAMDGG
ncbi:VOC family protein [Crenalkalicoccus roseus]|uniref:VOC family protein n=1 Tax=Crenalkalicoccus roseus TaxID=1485588 RepID=UPI001080CF44|nr:VOC family protein [Crenalkalicoccus roseus]